MDPLRILVVDEHPPTAMPVIDILVANGHRAEAHPGGLPALAALATKRQGGRPFHLVIANIAMADVDHGQFLRLLRERGEAVPVAFYGRREDLAGAAPAIATLDLPIDRVRLEALLIEVARKAAVATSTRFRTPLPEAPQGLLAPQTTAFRRTPRPADPPQTGTGTVVRGSEKYANTAPTTTRFRRSITGRTENPALHQEVQRQAPPAGWRVQCAQCRGEFQVEARPHAYNVVCVHCGQVNRIEPR